MTIPALLVTPGNAARAYATVANGVSSVADGAADFGAALGRAMQGVVDAGRNADGQAAKAISGGGNLTEVATAVSRAELALQSAVAVRDKVVQAYQDVMRMPI